MPDLDLLDYLPRTDTGHHVQVTDVFYEKGLILSPEKSLMMELLKDAIHQIDLNWINDSDTDYVLSFDRVCEELGLNPQAARIALNKQLEGRKKPKKWRKIPVEDFMDEGFTHRYEHQLHCPECKTRYQRGYAKLWRPCERWPRNMIFRQSRKLVLRFQNSVGICRLKTVDQTTRDIFYIRGILRNRVYVNEGLVMPLIRQAIDKGADVEKMKHLAKTVRSWTAWREAIESFIRGDDNDED
jgi:hypothetical protein